MNDTPAFLPVSKGIIEVTREMRTDTDAQAVALLGVHRDTHPPGPRVSVSWSDGASGQVPVGMALADLELTPTRLPAARGGKWKAPDRLTAILSWPPEGHRAWSLVDMDELVGVALITGAKRTVSRERLYQATRAVRAHHAPLMLQLPEARAGMVDESGLPWMSDAQGPLPQAVVSAVEWFVTRPEARRVIHLGAVRIELSRVTGAARRGIVVQAIPLTPMPWTAFHALSPQQRVVAGMACEHDTLDGVAAALGRSRETVKHHLKTVYRKLGIGTRVELQAAMGAARTGIV